MPTWQTMARAAADQAAGVPACRRAGTRGGPCHVRHGELATGLRRGARDAHPRRALERMSSCSTWTSTWASGPTIRPGSRRWIRERIVTPAAPAPSTTWRARATRPGRRARYAELLAGPPARPVLPGHRGERAPGLQRPRCGRLRRPVRRQGGRAGGGLPAATGQRRPFPRCDVGPLPRHHRDHPGSLRAAQVMAIVPEGRKAAPVRAALTGPVSTRCPASVLRTMPHVTIHLEPESARFLPG